MLGQTHLELPRGVRTFGPRDVKDQFHKHKKKDEILAVRDKIEGIYSSLPPDFLHDKSLFEMGFCFGLLDPLSNIFVNLSTHQGPLVAAKGGEPWRPVAAKGGEPWRPAGAGGEPSPPVAAKGGEPCCLLEQEENLHRRREDKEESPRRWGEEKGREPSPLAGAEIEPSTPVGAKGREPSWPAGAGRLQSPPARGEGREQVPPRARGVKRGREQLTPAEEMAQRSLDGLTAFLTCLFPYLPDAEAWKYLDAAGADPLVASLLIITRRNMQFDFSSQRTKAAVEFALGCAAVAAKHPSPERFVTVWRRVSTRAAEPRIPVSFLTAKGLQGSLIFRAPEATESQDFVLLSDVSWDSAKARFELAYPEILSSTIVLPSTRAHMKRMLLAKIHGFYIEALGRLPKVELCSCYHQSMLMGGYCYGPLDPVSNIILNTIWYEQNFPPSKQVEVSMISTHLLWRIVARSFYGLISFLCTRHQGITPDQAIESLLLTNVYLPAALDYLSSWSIDDCAALPLPVTASVADAYAAAGAAAFHCSHLAQSKFLASHIGDACELFPPHYQDGYPLSSEDISLICRVLQSCSSSSGTNQKQDIAPTKVKKRVYADMCRCSDSFWGQHDRVTSMVRNALDKFNETVIEDKRFELHVIFGVNEFVSGPIRSKDGKAREYNPWNNDKYCHSHINFLAVRKNHPFGAPTLFFAECGKDGNNTCWCVPVTPQKPESDKPRCIYCEHEANRIIHPTMEGFCGRDEFVELFYLSERKFYSNDEIIDYNGIYVDWVHNVADGAIYLNYYEDEDDDGGDEADWIEIF